MGRTANKKRAIYNENLKRQYISCFLSTSEAQDLELLEKGIVNLFARSEELEQTLGKDICEMDQAEVTCFLTQFLSGGQLYQMTTLSALRAYVDWAIANNLTRSTENPFTNIKVTDINVADAYINRMVKDENDLLESLEPVLDVINSDRTIKNVETVDSSRLCIFLLLFAGIPFKELFFIKKEDVDLESRVIMYGSQGIKISDTLYTALKYYFDMKELQKVGKGGIEYAKPIIDEGYLISNTKEFGSNRDKMRLSYTSDLSQIFKKCAKRLSPSSILDSGVFYRMCLKEQQTGEIDCLEYLRMRRTQSAVINDPDRVKKTCKHEYDTWKKAFSLKL